MVYYWCVYQMEKDNEKDISHTLIWDFSLLFHLFLLFGGFVHCVCVLVEGETLLHRACKRNQVETVLQILALPGTDVNVKGKAFSHSLFSVTSVFVVLLVRSCLLLGFEERLTLGWGGKGAGNRSVGASSLRLTFC